MTNRATCGTIPPLGRSDGGFFISENSNDLAFLWRGLLFSVLFHALVFLFFADFLALTVTPQPQALGEPAIHIVLHGQARPAFSSPEKLTSPNVLAVQTRQKTDFPRADSSAVTPVKLQSESLAPATSVTTEVPPNASEPKSGMGASLSQGGAQPIQIEPPSVDDLRLYRLSLGRAAKAHRHYPLLAKERGIEGTVVVVVSTKAGLAVPQVSLSLSSGVPMLDIQAIETIRLAVRDEKIPDGLLNRDFAIDLPIQFVIHD